MLENELIIPKLNNETIESMIYIIRGQKVMLDFEIAKIYGYETKNFNQQVNKNIENFPMDFRFQLSKEKTILIQRSQNVTTQIRATNKDELNSILMSKKLTSS